MPIRADKRRLSVTLPEQLYNELFERSEKLGVSASSLLVMYAVQFMEQQKMMDSMPKMLDQIQNVMNQATANKKGK